MVPGALPTGVTYPGHPHPINAPVHNFLALLAATALATSAALAQDVSPDSASAGPPVFASLDIGTGGIDYRAGEPAVWVLRGAFTTGTKVVGPVWFTIDTSLDLSLEGNDSYYLDDGSCRSRATGRFSNSNLCGPELTPFLGVSTGLALRPVERVIVGGGYRALTSSGPYASASVMLGNLSRAGYKITGIYQPGAFVATLGIVVDR